MNSLIASGSFALLVGGSACSDDEPNNPAGNAGSGGSSAGQGGDAGSGGNSAGQGGDAGASAAGSGMGGTGGSGMGVQGPTATVTVLADAQADVQRAATAAFRGTNIWYTNFQANTYFDDDLTPTLPFTLASVALADGAAGPTVDLPGDTYYPEGVASAADGTLYVGSALTGAIHSVAAGADAGALQAVEFLAPGTVAARAVIGMTVDEDRSLLWFCDSSLAFFDGNAAVAGGALVALNLADATEAVRHTLPETTSAATDVDAGAPDAGADAGASTTVTPFCNDVIVDDDGRLLVTDTLGGLVYEIPAANALTANSAVPFLTVSGPNGLDILGDNLVVVSGNGLVTVDLTDSDPQSTMETLTLQNADDSAADLCGPDGLATVPGSTTEIIVVENGGGNCDPAVSRIIKVTLDAD